MGKGNNNNEVAYEARIFFSLATNLIYCVVLKSCRVSCRSGKARSSCSLTFRLRQSPRFNRRLSRFRRAQTFCLSTRTCSPSPKNPTGSPAARSPDLETKLAGGSRGRVWERIQVLALELHFASVTRKDLIQCNKAIGSSGLCHYHNVLTLLFSHHFAYKSMMSIDLIVIHLSIDRCSRSSVKGYVRVGLCVLLPGAGAD